MTKKYTLEKRIRTNIQTNKKFYIYIISRYDLPDQNGLFQRVRVIADFHKNYQKAKGFLAYCQQELA